MHTNTLNAEVLIIVQGKSLKRTFVLFETQIKYCELSPENADLKRN